MLTVFNTVNNHKQQMTDKFIIMNCFIKRRWTQDWITEEHDYSSQCTEIIVSFRRALSWNVPDLTFATKCWIWHCWKEICVSLMLFSRQDIGKVWHANLSATCFSDKLRCRCPMTKILHPVKFSVIKKDQHKKVWMTWVYTESLYNAWPSGKLWASRLTLCLWSVTDV